MTPTLAWARESYRLATARLHEAAAAYDAAHDAVQAVCRALREEQDQRFSWKRGWVDQLHIAILETVLEIRITEQRAGDPLYRRAVQDWDLARQTAEEAEYDALSDEEKATARWKADKRAHGYDVEPGGRTGD